MSDRPTRKWRKVFFRFFLPALALDVLIATRYWNRDPYEDGPSWWFFPIVSVVIMGVFWAAFFFLRWLCCWRNFRRFLIVAGCFAALVAAFYFEENWRGERAWEAFKREWEAKGEKFSLTELAPPPVPDDLNFAMTPIVASCWDWLVDRHGHKLTVPKTSVTNRLMMDIYRKDYYPTNIYHRGNWQKSQPADLKVWQEYYRARFKTNETFDWPLQQDSQSQPVVKVSVVPLATNEFPVAPQPQTPAADVLLALSKYDSAIEELRQASRLPHSRFPLAYDLENPDDLYFAYLASCKSSAQFLQLRVASNLQLGQSESALADAKLALRLNESIRAEPFVISQLVRMAMWQITLQPIWEGLAGRRWSDVQLIELECELAKLDFLADFQLSMDGERALAIRSIRYMSQRRGWRDFAKVVRETKLDWSLSNWKEFAFSIGVYLMPSGWYHQNELAVARLLQKFTSTVATENGLCSPPKAAKEFEIASTKVVMPERPWNLFVGSYVHGFSKARFKFAFAQSSVDLARTAIALERYRLAHGNYPDSLTALAPQFLAQVPHDVIGGQPLHYRREANGQFTLYSIGWNETDDGGVVGLRESGSVDNAQGDWVWRYPAP